MERLDLKNEYGGVNPWISSYVFLGYSHIEKNAVFRDGIFKLLRNRFLCSLAGRYENPIPTRFLAAIYWFKIPALEWNGRMGIWHICMQCVVRVP
jgi:hypothetical protein